MVHSKTFCNFAKELKEIKMKKIIKIGVLFVFVLNTSCSKNIYSFLNLSYSEQLDYEFMNDVSSIQKRKNTESKNDYLKRIKYETDSLKHVHFHKYWEKDCYFCKEIMNEFQRKREIEKQKEEQKEEQKSIYINNYINHKLDSIKICYPVIFIDSLRKDFISKTPIDSIIETEKKNAFIKLKEIEKRIKFYKSQNKKYNDKLVKNEKLRFTELDQLEKRYAGRLIGEIFMTHKLELDYKWKKINEKIILNINDINLKIEEEKKEIDSTKCYIINMFNLYLEKKGVPYWINPDPLMFNDFLDDDLYPVGYWYEMKKTYLDKQTEKYRQEAIEKAKNIF